MLKKIVLIGLSVITLSSISSGQKNNIYTELGGAGYTKTFNYERMLTNNLLARAGYGSSKAQVLGDKKIRFMPIGAAYLMGLGDHKFELGGGMTMVQGTLEMRGEYIEDNSTYFGGGYRYQKGTGGFLLSVKGYYLFLGKFSAPWAGMSVGWTL
ncbi:hypothetical protein OAD01_01655 [Candidatus Marinimicrobia bacterium]|nr:hypothetical protein [Candidatus Neomarinimicrobiota bacterium]